MRTGNVIILLGAAIVVIGLVVRFAPWLVSWFGRLPGDIRIETETSRIYIPLVSMIIVSVVLGTMLWLIGRLRG